MVPYRYCDETTSWPSLRGSTSHEADLSEVQEKVSALRSKVAGGVVASISECGLDKHVIINSRGGSPPNTACQEVRE